MNPGRFCVSCAEPATKIDLDYDEAYCDFHFNEWQRSSEPITNWIDA